MWIFSLTDTKIIFGYNLIASLTDFSNVSTTTATTDKSKTWFLSVKSYNIFSKYFKIRLREVN